MKMKTNMSMKMGWLSLAMAVAMLAATQTGSAAEPMGSTTNPATGETISVYKNADGTRDVVKTDANGNEISRETHGNEPATKADMTKKPDSVSTKDKDGNTTTITHNADGSKTKTVTDKDGKEISNEKIEKEPATKVDKTKKPDSVSTKDKDGNTTTITTNADGSKTKTVTDKDGNEISKEKIEKDPVTKVAKKDEPKGGEGVNPDNGVKTQVILNGNGTKTIVITKDGKEMYRETIKTNDEMSQEAEDLQGFPPIHSRVVVVAPQPVYVERRVIVEDRSPRFTIGLGFGFGSSNCHNHKSHCTPCPSKKKCK